MKSVALVAVGISVTVALALSVAGGASASSDVAPSPSTIYQTYVANGDATLGPQSSPTTVLTSQVLPIGSYHVQVEAEAVLPGDGQNVVCSLATAATADTVTGNQGTAANGAYYYTTDGTVGINGTVTITQSNDRVSMVCYVDPYEPPPGTYSYISEASLTAQAVNKVKLHQA